MTVKEIYEREDTWADRDAPGTACPCGGYADRVHNHEFTKKQIKSRLNCGRSYACCIGAFKCRICKTTLVMPLAAPDPGW